MKKTIAILIAALLVMCLASCRVRREKYKLLNTEDSICDVSIVTVSFSEEDDIIQTEIKQINDINGFMDDFEEVPCYIYFGDPTGVTEWGKEADVIKIAYDNGEYELINHNGQARYTLENGFSFYAGFSVFDKSSFNALIEKCCDNKYD